ncbi:hypothetical protein R1flu_005585 [Riccia fluitans]|uniref:Chloride channel protein n=1 Tax=Riccia fluitans TaxID=41844 RepID=A0ABD1YTK9_9MARC
MDHYQGDHHHQQHDLHEQHRHHHHGNESDAEALTSPHDSTSSPRDKHGLHTPLLQRKNTLLPEASYSVEKHQAMVGANVCPIESLDYELIENELFRQDWRSRTKHEILQYVFLKWTFVFLLGVMTALIGFGINMAVENIAGAKFLAVTKFMSTRGFVASFLLYAGSNAVLILLGSMLCVYVSPAAAGSGIPEVKAYLNGVDAPNIFSPQTLLVKVLGCICTVSGGLIVGKEGPLVHVGSCLASILGQGGSKKYHLTWKWLRHFKNDRDRRDLVTCGSAAGVAAAFRAPVGGVLFALEEVTSWWRGPLLWRAFFTTAVVLVVLRTGMAWCKGGACGLFGEGGLIIFDVEGVKSEYGLLELFPVIVLGIIGGVLGSLFNSLNSKIVVFFGGVLNKRWPSAKVVQAVLIALLTATISFVVPWFAECRPCPEHKVGVLPIGAECPTHGRAANFKGFHCPPGTYNDLANLFFNTNDDATRNLFSIGTGGEFRKSSLLIYLACSYFLAVITYGIAVPSGLFVPAILCGATYGRLVGMLMGPIAGEDSLDEGVYALLGAASFLGGSMRMTVSLCIILLELTNNLRMLPLIMFVLLVSKTVGDSFNDAVFDIHVFLKGFPFLDAHPEPFMRHLTAKEAISGPPITFKTVEKVGTVVDVLKTTRHNAFPVLEENGAYLCGLVLRSHIMVLLEKREFLPRLDDSYDAEGIRLSSADFAKPGSGKNLKSIGDLHFSAEVQEMFLDLRFVTNTSPYTVVETMSLAKAFTLFRQLGLRHLCVIPRKPRPNEGSPIVGLLTRHDFMPGYLHEMHPHLRS